MTNTASIESSDPHAGEFAAELASALNTIDGETGWRSDTSREWDRHYAVIFCRVGPDKLSVNIYEGRVSVSGIYPHLDSHGAQFDRRANRVAIGVSVSRGVAVVAKEVIRRLLPEYRRELVAHAEALATHERYIAGKRSLAARIGALIGEKPRDNDTSGQVRVGGTALGEIWGSIYCSENNVKLELHDLTPEQAEAALKAIMAVKT